MSEYEYYERTIITIIVFAVVNLVFTGICAYSAVAEIKRAIRASKGQP